MEKKITKKFYYLSSLNLVTVVWLSNGFNLDTLALFLVLVVLVLNHTTLVKMVGGISQSMAHQGEESKKALNNVLLLVLLKMTLLALVMAGIYFYNVGLIARVLILMILQLIIQVVSIKNNY